MKPGWRCFQARVKLAPPHRGIGRDHGVLARAGPAEADHQLGPAHFVELDADAISEALLALLQNQTLVVSEVQVSDILKPALESA